MEGEQVKKHTHPSAHHMTSEGATMENILQTFAMPKHNNAKAMMWLVLIGVACIGVDVLLSGMKV